MSSAFDIRGKWDMHLQHVGEPHARPLCIANGADVPVEPLHQHAASLTSAYWIVSQHTMRMPCCWSLTHTEDSTTPERYSMYCKEKRRRRTAAYLHLLHSLELVSPVAGALQRRRNGVLFELALEIVQRERHRAHALACNGRWRHFFIWVLEVFRGRNGVLLVIALQVLQCQAQRAHGLARCEGVRMATLTLEDDHFEMCSSTFGAPVHEHRTFDCDGVDVGHMEHVLSSSKTSNFNEGPALRQLDVGTDRW